jgi:hypothetical protein
VSHTDPESGKTAFDLVGSDVDVSCDGSEWFHLLGAFCKYKLPKLFTQFPASRVPPSRDK